MRRKPSTPQDVRIRKIITSNLKKFAKEKNVSQAQIARDLDMPKTTVSSYFTMASTPTPSNVQKFANYFGVNKSDIDPRFSSNVSNVIEIKRTQNIPVLGSIACGAPIFADENIDDLVAFPNDLLPSGKLFFLKAKGDSMTPIINDGGYVLVRQQEIVENGEIAAIIFDDSNEVTLKRVKYIGSNIMLETENSDYDPIILNEDQRPRIIGRAVNVYNKL